MALVAVAARYIYSINFEPTERFEPTEPTERCELPATRMTPAERNRVVSAVKAEERRRKKAKEGTTRTALVAVGLVLLAALAVPLLRRPKQLVETPPMKPDDALLKRPPEQPGSTSHATAVQAAASPVTKSPADTSPGRAASSPRTDEEGLADAQAEVTRRTAAMGEKRAVACANVHSNAECEAWAGAGQCDANPGFMHLHCAAACAACATLDAADSQGYSPLVSAVLDEQAATAAALLTAGATVGAALHWACALGRSPSP